MKYTLSRRKILGLFFILISLVAVFIYMWINYLHETSIKNSQVNIVKIAKAYYISILDVRAWSATHESLFVINPNIKPNPYLEKNIKKFEDGQLAIKINPAWMTRQISEISKKRGHFSFKMVSLSPLNPNNIPDDFEKKALHYFEINKNSTTYHNFREDNKGKVKLDFVGVFKVEESCMECHARQGYKVGNVRGGIRVKISLDEYQEQLDLIKKQTFINRVIAITTLILLFALVYVIISLTFKNEEKY